MEAVSVSKGISPRTLGNNKGSNIIKSILAPERYRLIFESSGV